MTLLAVNFALLSYCVVIRWELRRARQMQLRLGDRIFAAHEVLARRAERKEP